MYDGGGGKTGVRDQGSGVRGQGSVKPCVGQESRIGTRVTFSSFPYPLGFWEEISCFQGDRGAIRRLTHMLPGGRTRLRDRAALLLLAIYIVVIGTGFGVSGFASCRESLAKMCPMRFAKNICIDHCSVNREVYPFGVPVLNVLLGNDYWLARAGRGGSRPVSLEIQNLARVKNAARNTDTRVSLPKLQVRGFGGGKFFNCNEDIDTTRWRLAYIRSCDRYFQRLPLSDRYLGAIRGQSYQRPLFYSEVFIGSLGYFSSLLQLSGSGQTLPSSEEGIQGNNSNRDNFKPPFFMVFGVLLFLCGIAGEAFFWTRLNRDFSTNRHIAADTALQIISAMVVWAAMACIAHGCGIFP